MSRFARLALLLALAGTLALPQAVVAAPPDGHDSGLAATTCEWLAGLWTPLARLFGASEGGPMIDPNGVFGGQPAGGPGIDPNGIGGGPTIDPNGVTGHSQGGPYIDPDGLAGDPSPSSTRDSSAGDDETDGGPTIDPDG